MIYRTGKLPYLQRISSIQAHQAGQWVVTIEDFHVDGKEYVVTSSHDSTVKIWHLIKGRIRFFRIIHVEAIVYSLVYLEGFKMIAMVYENYQEIRFFNVFSGKLERTFSFSEDTCPGSGFLMKDKNMNGVVPQQEKEIKCIQLDDGRSVL